jgi:hypothetical protein
MCGEGGSTVGSHGRRCTTRSKLLPSHCFRSTNLAERERERERDRERERELKREREGVSERERSRERENLG